MPMVVSHLERSDSATSGKGPGEIPAVPNRATRPNGRSDPFRWLAILTALLWPIVEVVRIIGEPVHEVVFGDYALFELAARRAWQLNQLLGPDAAPGFNHPGPAMFYLLAPAVRLLSPGPGLYLGALLINAAALLATAVFVGRRTNARVALWTAGVLNLFCLSVGVNTLRQPWNPYLLIVPMLLFVVLWAAAVTQVAGAWLWAAVVGSYEIQTHVTTALFVTFMVLIGGLWSLAVMARRTSPRHPRGWWYRPARMIGLLALVLIWLPSTIELVVDHPNNWQQTWAWLHHGHSVGIAVHTSLGIVLRSIAAFPLQHHVWTNPLPPNGVEEVAGWLILAAGAALIGWLWRRRQWFAVALGSASILSVPLATITVSHATGDEYAFLTGWLAFVPYVLLLALGVGLFTAAWRPPEDGPKATATWSRKATAWTAVAALACASIAVVSDLREESVATVNRIAAQTSSFIPDAEAQLKLGDRWVGFLIVSASDEEVAAGVVLELQRRGYHTLVDPRFRYVFGKQITVWHHPTQVIFTFYLANNLVAAKAAPGRIVSSAGGTVMTAWRPDG